eukprot:3540343-Amphidinium_carterae.1
MGEFRVPWTSTPILALPPHSLMFHKDAPRSRTHTAKGAQGARGAGFLLHRGTTCRYIETSRKAMHQLDPLAHCMGCLRSRSYISTPKRRSSSR